MLEMRMWAWWTPGSVFLKEERGEEASLSRVIKHACSAQTPFQYKGQKDHCWFVNLIS